MNLNQLSLHNTQYYNSYGLLYEFVPYIYSIVIVRLTKAGPFLNFITDYPVNSERGRKGEEEKGSL